MPHKATIFFDERVWHAFRVACVQRKTSASDEIRRLVQEQLDDWNDQERDAFQQQLEKERDHA
jgi:hypothetical protein